MRIYLMLILILILSLSPCFKAQELSQTFDVALKTLYQQQFFNGSVLIAKGDKILFQKAYGFADVEQKISLTTASSFNLASVSKQFTAMGIMILAEQKKLSYEDPVQKYLSELSYSKITIRHLLHHTSGISDYMDLMGKHWDTEQVATNQDILALFQKHKPKLRFKPGERFEYSNTGYAMLALLIEKVSQQTFAQFLQENIFQPLQMKNTFVYHLKLESSPLRVFGLYFSKGKAKLNDLIYLDGVVGDGSVYSSVEDLFKWDQALYTEKLVKNSTLELAFTPAILNNQEKTRYGFGWVVSPEEKIVSHGGGWVGFRTHIWRDLKNKQTMIILDNSSNAKLGLVREILLKIMAGEKYQLPVKKKAIALDPKIYKRYVGVYHFTPLFSLTIFIQKNSLWTKATGQSAIEILPLSETRFFIDEVEAEIQFVSNKKGEIVELILFQNGEHRGRKVQQESEVKKK